MIETEKKTYVFLWLLCILGVVSLIPYMRHLNILTDDLRTFIFFVQSSLIYGIVCGICYFLIPKTDLHPFRTINAWYGIVCGLVVGVVIYLPELTPFRSSLESVNGPPAWMGLISSVYGAVNEEVILRLFFFSLLYFLFCKVVNTPRTVLLHVVNVIVALSFGLGHLPALYKLTEPTTFEIARVLCLNGFAGLVFGWLYWSRGIWTAMVAHFAADIAIHAVIV